MGCKYYIFAAGYSFEGTSRDIFLLRDIIDKIEDSWWSIDLSSWNRHGDEVILHIAENPICNDEHIKQLEQIIEKINELLPHIILSGPDFVTIGESGIETGLYITRLTRENDKYQVYTEIYDEKQRAFKRNLRFL